MATRGVALLLLKNKVLMSIEFNGDMYPSGYGDEFFEMLSKVESEEDFENFVKKFNDKHFQYDDDEFVFEISGGEFYSPFSWENQPHINMKDVSSRLMADWIFMKNGTKSTWMTLDANKDGVMKQTQILPGQTHRYQFDSYPQEGIEYRIDKGGVGT